MATKTTTKITEKKAVKSAVKPTEPRKPGVAAAKTDGISAEVFSLLGKQDGTILLPKSMFGVELNKNLISQAVRVYLANQRSGTSATKTRGEVIGSTRKIYRQKGTGRARHGAITAPIFVGGGIVFGPSPRDHSLSLSKKMKRKALLSILSSKFSDKFVNIVSGLEKIEPKTKAAAKVLADLSIDNEKEKVLLLISKDYGSVLRSFKNLRNVTVLPAIQLNTYEVIKNSRIVFTKSAVDEFIKHFTKEDRNVHS